MPKIHYEVNGRSACGRGTRTHASATQVTCLACGKRPEFIEAIAKAEADKMERFLAQTPAKVSEPWHDGHPTMKCSKCGWVFFRHADRSCYGHYDNWVCAQCGHTESRLTETGMSF